MSSVTYNSGDDLSFDPTGKANITGVIYSPGGAGALDQGGGGGGGGGGCYVAFAITDASVYSAGGADGLIHVTVPYPVGVGDGTSTVSVADSNGNGLHVLTGAGAGGDGS